MLEDNEKEKGSKDKKAISVPQNRQTVREFPYGSGRNVASKVIYGSQDSKYKDNVRKNYNTNSFVKTPRQTYLEKTNNRVYSKLSTQIKQTPYQAARPASLGTYQSKAPHISSVPVSYGAASLRLEKLKNKLAEDRLKDQNCSISKQDQHRDLLEKEKKTVFKEKHKSSIFESRLPQHPYASSSLDSRTQPIPSSKCVDAKFKSVVPYRSDKGLGSVQSLNVSSRNKSISTKPYNLDIHRKLGFTEDYLHSLGSKSLSLGKEGYTKSSCVSSIFPEKKWPVILANKTFFKNTISDDPVCQSSVHYKLFRNPVSNSSSINPYPLEGDKHSPVSQQLEKNKYVSNKSDGYPFLNYETSLPALELNESSYENRHFLQNNNNGIKLSSGTMNRALTFQSKTPAADRLKRLKTQLQSKSIKHDAVCNEGKANNFPRNRSCKEKDFSSANSYAVKSNSDRLSTTNDESSVNSTINNDNTWKWNAQCLVRDYNHQRVDNLSDFPAISSRPHELKSTNVEHLAASSSSENNTYLRRNSNESASNLETNISYSKCSILSKAEYNSGIELINSPFCNKSQPNPQQCIENQTCKFVEPNQETLRRLHQNTPKKKVQESKGGISKLNRRVQKQIRTVVPKLGKISALFPEKKELELRDNRNAHETGKIEDENGGEEMMDWEPIEPEKVVIHVEELRKDGSLLHSANSELSDLCNLKVPISSKWFIVLDTNVLLSHLEFVEYLRDIKDYAFGMPTLYIPWIVLQELDGLKSTNKNPTLKFYARKAVRFLQDNLECRHPRVRGQPKSSKNQRSQQPDDSILQCSLDLQKSSCKVLLVTNDRNLFNKAVVSGVDCCSAARLHEDLEKRRNSISEETGFSQDTNATREQDKKESQQGEEVNMIVCQIKECLKTILEEILKTEMILAYDRSWICVVSRKPPWTVNDVLFCILKHWIAVFGLVFPSSAHGLLEKILAMFQKSYMHSLSEAENLLNVCVSLITLLSTVSYKQMADKALYTLQELKQSLEQLNCANKVQLPSTISPSSADKLSQNKISGEESSSDCDSRSTVSRGSSKASKGSRSFSGNEENDIERRIHNNTTFGNDSDDDCISLVASSFCDNVFNKQLSESSIKEGQETVHNHLNKIWEKVAVFCGTLCDLMGVKPCVPYEPPNPFPRKEILHQNMLFFVKCVSGLLRCVERILSYPSGELFDNHPAVLNFCSFIKDSLPNLSVQESNMLPHHVYIYCTRSDTRQQLENGKKQFEQFERILNDAVSFFLKQNMPGINVMPLL